MENETIGKIKLDYTHYAGSDLYCDGEVEGEILEEVKKRPAAASYADVIEKHTNWPFLYHLSPIRENIVSWLPISSLDKVLEVGSGCGAITGALAAKAGSVDCVDLSRQRSLINAYRHENCDNVTIHVGNFQDIEPDLPTDYSLICLIGVFEYGQAYIGGDNPYETFLNILKKHLAPGGRIVIAIENKFGLKYFAGCKEDHVGKFFEGIEDYPGDSPARTFTENGLLKIAEKCGFSKDQCTMYYPYPDYKFMNTLFSKKRLPEEGELKDNLRNFDRDRLLLFNEKLAFDNILREGQFPLFSNSYMLVLGKDTDTVYVRYSNDRKPESSIATEIREVRMGIAGGEAIKTVTKRALCSEAKEHIKKIAENYELLKKRYAGSKLEICPCELSLDEKEISFPFLTGRRLEELLDERLLKKDFTGFKALLKEFYERIGYGAGVTDMDLIFSNVIVNGDKWTAIDYEWLIKEDKPAGEIAYRALYCYELENNSRNIEDKIDALEIFGISATKAEEIKRAESTFQKEVTGGYRSLGEIRESIGNEVVDISKNGTAEITKGGKLQVYYDFGNGFSEKDSYFAERDGEGFTVELKGGLKSLRLDPCDYPCVVSIRQMSVGEKQLNVSSVKMISNGAKAGEGIFVFGSADPNITLKLGSADMHEGNTLKVVFDISPISENIAAAVLAESADAGLGSKIKRKLSGF